MCKVSDGCHNVLTALSSRHRHIDPFVMRKENIVSVDDAGGLTVDGSVPCV